METPENTGRNQDGTFVKGISGNPAGKPKGARHMTTLLFEALQQKVKDKEGNITNVTYQDLFIQRILKDSIEKGNTSLMNMVMAYIDGQPKQGIDLTTNGESISSSSVDLIEMARKLSQDLKSKKTE